MVGIRAWSEQAVRIFVLAGVLVGAVGCQSQDGRTFNGLIDQEEENAREQVRLYEAFETELLTELRNEYGADVDGGCPELQTLPAVRMRDSGLGLLWNRRALQQLDEQEDQRIANENAARTEAWSRNIPAEHCRCIQETVRNVRARRDTIDLTQFGGVREELAQTSDEVLAQRIAFGGIPEPGFSPELARIRIADWTGRRYEDWRNVRGRRWEPDETSHGWEDYRYAARGGTVLVPETDQPLLTRDPIWCSVF